ncbi:efflux RND transporter periplasmic adaptor subunit [Halomonas sp. HNIBRBA4712]|uniref:efflux RND transporter periplasmic adaptor subunit n=1 Tax=Halomonas sp. HNIBRBA4712 TaxID=3373087 RepID=UPI003745045D
MAQGDAQVDNANPSHSAPTAQTTPEKRGRKWLLLAIGLIALAALGWWLVGWWQVGRFMIDTDNAYVRTDSVALSAELSARVVDVAVIENQTVQRGDLLVQLDDAGYRDQLNQARAQQAVAAAALAQTRRQVALQQAAIDQARTQVDAAQADVDRARAHLERSTSLAANNYGSRQQREDDESALRVAEATLASRRAGVVSAERQLAVAESDVTRGEASQQAAEADFAYAQHQLDKTRITAPRDGVIGNLRVKTGALAQPSLTLMQLVPIESAYISANYKETQLERIRIGQPAAIHLDAYPNITFEGVVESLSPATGTEFSLLPQDNATGNFNKIVQRVPVRIRVTGPRESLGLLRAGLSAVPEIDTRGLDSERDDRQASAALEPQTPQ